MIVHYVEFGFPGIVFSETASEKIDERNIESVVMPEHSFGFRFYDKEEQLSPNGSLLTSERRNMSNWFYVGKHYTTKQVEIEMPQETILLSNLRINKIDNVVKTSRGSIFPLYEGDTILESHQVKYKQ